VGECSFWYRPTRVVPDQRPLNGRCCCCCSGERSFSALKRIEKSKMLDEKLNHLSVMSIESGVLRKLDFSDTISEFVKKSEKNVLLIHVFHSFIISKLVCIVFMLDVHVFVK